MESKRQGSWTQDFLASIVVALVALPLCMGIAIASGVPIAAGLMTGIIAGLVVGLLSGVPLQVSGPAAGLVVLVAEMVHSQGREQFGLIVILAGLLQLLAGVVRLGPVFRAVSPAVVRGMLAGIGVLICASQFHVMLDDKPKGTGIDNIVSIPNAVQKVFSGPAIPPRDERPAQRDALQKIGELHRQQNHLHDLTSNTRNGSTVTAHHVADDQIALHQELTKTLDAAVASYAAEPEQQAAIRQQGAEVLATLASLEAARDAGKTDEAHELTATAATGLERLLATLKNHELAALIGVISICVLAFWKAIVPKTLGVIPAPLVAVVFATTIATVWRLPVTYVEVPDALWEEIQLPTWQLLQSANWSTILLGGVTIAVIASAETLLSSTAVDQMHNGPRAQYNRELLAQGTGNMLCGLVGALPMTGVIVRSTANVQAGAQTRLSATLHGGWLLLFAAVFPFVLRMIPTAALAAILVYTGYKLVDWKSAVQLLRYGKWELVIYLATLGTIVATDLLTGVIVGISLAIIRLALNLSRLHIDVLTAADGPATLRLKGAATFLRLPKLAAVLESMPKGHEVRLDVERLTFLDHACFDLLSNWARQHGAVQADWESLDRLCCRTPTSGSTPAGEPHVSPQPHGRYRREPARVEA